MELQRDGMEGMILPPEPPKEEKELYPVKPRQEALENMFEKHVEEWGKFDQSTGANGAHYAPAEANPFQKEGLMCANCVFYQGPRGCELVAGDIDPLAVCKMWVIPEKLIVLQRSMDGEGTNMSNSTWKITIPVDRAEEQDGGLFLYGQASGPERDSHGTEMDPTAIQDFADQIVSRATAGDPLPYLDHHMKDGVLRELGEVVDGSVSEDYRLNIKVRLHPDNPAAAYLHGRIKAGKKYGMSIAGDGVQYRMIEDDSTKEKVIRFLKIKLREISNTTRPSWVPSFGTVLARSIEGEEIGDNMAEELVKSDAPEVETNVAVESAEPVVEQVTEQTENPKTEEAPAEAAAAPAEVEAPAAAPVEAAAPEVVEADEVERARIAKRDAKALVDAFNALKGHLESLGVFSPDEEAPQAAEVAKTDEVEAAADENVDFNGVSVRRDLAEAITAFVTAKVDESTAVLRETVEKQAEYIKKLEELPAGKLPAPVIREKFEDNSVDISAMSNEQKLKFALGNIYK